MEGILHTECVFTPALWKLLVISQPVSHGIFFSHVWQCFCHQLQFLLLSALVVSFLFTTYQTDYMLVQWTDDFSLSTLLWTVLWVFQGKAQSSRASYSLEIKLIRHPWASHLSVTWYNLLSYSKKSFTLIRLTSVGEPFQSTVTSDWSGKVIKEENNKSCLHSGPSFHCLPTPVLCSEMETEQGFSSLDN